MKIERSTNIGVIVTKGGNSKRTISRMSKMGIELPETVEPIIINKESHNSFVRNIFSLRDKAVS